MRGDIRQSQGGLRSIEGIAGGQAMMFTAAMLFVVATAIVGGLLIGMHLGK